MKISLISGALGAEIKGIDLKDSSEKNWKTINDLLLEHKVLFFRNQNISAEEQINFAKRFGPLEKHVYVKGRDQYPEIIRIIKKPDEKHQWGENWHTDVSYNPKIQKITTETPKAAAFVEAYKGMEGNGNIDEYSNSHPIVRTHPETGKKILYVNSMYTKRIEGLDENESDEILKKLYTHQERLDLTCRFRWTENAVAIWDNRSTQHQGLSDFFPGRGLGHERVMDRVAIEGDQPI